MELGQHLAGRQIHLENAGRIKDERMHRLQSCFDELLGPGSKCSAVGEKQQTREAIDNHTRNGLRLRVNGGAPGRPEPTASSYVRFLRISPGAAARIGAPA